MPCATDKLWIKTYGKLPWWRGSADFRRKLARSVESSTAIETGRTKSYFNPNHEPAGSPEGGQFAPGEGGSEIKQQLENQHLKEALRFWVAGSSSERSDVNSRLRTGKILDRSEERTLKQHISSLDQAIQNSRLDAPLTVYRGGPDLGKVSSIQDKGYLAVSRSRAVAERFANGYYQGQVYAIHLPHGAHALDIGTLGFGKMNEGELLLPRGVKISVTVLPRGKTFSAGSRSFASTQLDLPNDLRAKCRAWVIANVSQEDLSPLEVQDDVFHITVQSGLHGDEPRDVSTALKGLGPAIVTFGRVEQLEADEYDVLVIPVVEEVGLVALRAALARLPHTDTFSNYKPHVTLAYVMKGAGRRHLGDASFLGDSITLDRLKFSDAKGAVSWMSLLPAAKTFEWDESLHPRVEAGSPEGGQFGPGGRVPSSDPETAIHNGLKEPESKGRELDSYKVEMRAAEVYLRDVLKPIETLLPPSGITEAGLISAQGYASALQQWTKANNTESGVMIDNITGLLIGPVIHGNAAGVGVASQLLKLKTHSDATHIHTHPDSASFSYKDIGMLVAVPQIRRLIVRGKDGTTYTLEKGPDYYTVKPLSQKKIEWQWKGWVDKLDEQYSSGLFAKSSKAKALWKEHSNAIMENFSKELHLTYHRYPPRTTKFSGEGDDNRRIVGLTNLPGRPVNRGTALQEGTFIQVDGLNRTPTAHERKVDFAAIDSATKMLTAQGRDRVRTILANAKTKLVALVTSRHDAGKLTTKFILDLELRGLGDLVPTLRGILSEGFRVGQREAKKELKAGKHYTDSGGNGGVQVTPVLSDPISMTALIQKLIARYPDWTKAQLKVAVQRVLKRARGPKIAGGDGHAYAVTLDQTGLSPEYALQFFERKAILWGADIRQPLLSAIKSLLFDGIKRGSSMRDLQSALELAFLPWLGDPDQMVNDLTLTPYRLETLVRTNITEALNEGRKAQFQSSVDDGFIIGMLFSAVLDARTCFRAGTLVTMANGERCSIERIGIGDLVLAGSGIPRRVLGLKRHSAYEWRRLTMESGETVICTKTHPLWSAEGWREAHEIRFGDTLGTHMPGVQKNRSCLDQEKPRQDLWQQNMPVYSFSSNSSQQSRAISLQKMRQICDGFKQMLSDSNGEDREALCTLRKDNHSKRFIRQEKSGSSSMLLNGLLSHVSKKRNSKRVFTNAMRSLSKVLSSSSRSGAQGQAQTALLNDMSETPCKAEMSFVRKGVRIFADIQSTILLGDVLSQVEVRDKGRGNGSYGVGTVWSGLSAGSEAREIFSRLSSACTQSSHRGGWSLLAQEREFEEQGADDTGCGAVSVPFVSRGDFGSGQAGSVSGPDCTPCPAPTGWARVQANEIIEGWDIAYDLEVEHDHCYIAEGLIVHNTEVCKHLDGKIFPPDSQDLDRLTPPRNWNCRSILVPVTRLEGPVKYITSKEIEQGIRLSGTGFACDGHAHGYEWDESLHPRVEAGSPEGGQFGPGGGGATFGEIPPIFQNSIDETKRNWHNRPSPKTAKAVYEELSGDYGKLDGLRWLKANAWNGQGDFKDWVLNGTITIYRGGSAPEKPSLGPIQSWTLDRRVAERAARNVFGPAGVGGPEGIRDIPGKVISKEIHPADIVGGIWSEKEILLPTKMNVWNTLRSSAWFTGTKRFAQGAGTRLPTAHERKVDFAAIDSATKMLTAQNRDGGQFAPSEGAPQNADAIRNQEEWDDVLVDEPFHSGILR